MTIEQFSIKFNVPTTFVWNRHAINFLAYYDEGDGTGEEEGPFIEVTLDNAKVRLPDRDDLSDRDDCQWWMEIFPDEPSAFDYRHFGEKPVSKAFCEVLERFLDRHLAEAQKA